MDEIGVGLAIPIISVSGVSLATDNAQALSQSERPALLTLPSALPNPPLQPQPKHEIIPLYAGPQRPANA